MRLYVNLEGLEQQLSKMKDLCDCYRDQYGQLFSKIDESGLYWKGKDQEAFITRIHGFEDDFIRMYQALKQYVDFLEKSLQTYRMCQDEAEASSLRLVQ